MDWPRSLTATTTQTTRFGLQWRHTSLSILMTRIGPASCWRRQGWVPGSDGALVSSQTGNLRTPPLLKEAGLTYTGDWVVDDRPFPIKAGNGWLLGVPYSL